MDKKKIIITSSILGSIGAISALLISLVNLVTKDVIASNKVKKVREGIVELYGENVTFNEQKIIESYTYLEKYYEVYQKEDSSNKVGYAFITSGSNLYGKLSLLVGIGTDASLGDIYIINNEQTANEFIEGYIDPWNSSSSDEEKEGIDIHCGATFASRLVKEMVESSQKYVTNVLLKDGE